jgi:hypothetical protein
MSQSGISHITLQVNEANGTVTLAIILNVHSSFCVKRKRDSDYPLASMLDDMKGPLENLTRTLQEILYAARRIQHDLGITVTSHTIDLTDS